MEKIIVPIIRHAHGEGLPLPFYATLGSVGLDLFAAISEPISLAPGHRFLVVTGISISLPPGYEGQIRPRSGLALKHGISVLNSPGTIDWDYRGEIKVILINQGHESFLIERETRIAQLIIAPVKQVIWQEVSDFETLEESGRGEDGFGSTGLKKVV